MRKWIVDRAAGQEQLLLRLGGYVIAELVGNCGLALSPDFDEEKANTKLLIERIVTVLNRGIQSSCRPIQLQLSLMVVCNRFSHEL